MGRDWGPLDLGPVSVDLASTVSSTADDYHTYRLSAETVRTDKGSCQHVRPVRSVGFSSGRYTLFKQIGVYFTS